MPDSLTETYAAAAKFLREQSTLALATVGADGLPCVAPLFYVCAAEGLILYWLSSPESKHSVNLTREAHVAATVYPAVRDWQAIRGLQMEGMAEAVSDEAKRQRVLALYRAKFKLPEQFDAEIERSMLYEFRPLWLRWLDNGEKFGHKAEIHLAHDQ